MSGITFTPEQKRAIETFDRDMIVAAAAGSGKTAVLAERCAYLVSDAPSPHRCDADQLLVLTYTDAAAAEMRSRVIEAIRSRVAASPDDARLREQLDRAEFAHISTIHSFCRQIIRRWFQEADVDPSATQMDDTEAKLMREEVLDELLEEHYGQGQPDSSTSLVELLAVAKTDSPTSNEPQPQHVDAPSASGSGEKKAVASVTTPFTKLVEVYGLGDDASLRKLVLSIHSFVRSLPNPRGWLTDAVRRTREHPESYLTGIIAQLRTELSLQLEWLRGELTHGDANPHGAQLGGPTGLFRDLLQSCLDRLPVTEQHPTSGIAESWSSVPVEGVHKLMDAYDDVRERLADYLSSPTPSARKGDEGAKLAAEFQRECKKRIKDMVEKGLCAFSAKEYIQTALDTAPYVETIVRLVGEFNVKYRARKRRMGLLDFSDLEERAYALLVDPNGRRTAVAEQLRRTIAHVLIDEFQDINPIQQAIVQALLGEAGATDSPSGRLFVVGDVKQSIYRFRLAEPRIFLEKFNDAKSRKDSSTVCALSLQRNFRSRPEILDAVNSVFELLMRPGLSEVHYDELARLNPGRQGVKGGEPTPVELHLIDQKQPADHRDHDDDETNGSESDMESSESELSREPGVDSARWSSIQKEAYLIGSTLKGWMQSGMTVEGRPMRWSDAAVLLRSAKFKADQMTTMLHKMGIPAQSAAGSSFMESREIRDIVAGLSLIDNSRQDIPLASVLRSGLFGVVLSEDDLVAIRTLDKSVPFHVAAKEFSTRGDDADLRDELTTFFVRIEHFRTLARRRPTADVLNQLYHRHGYLSSVCALPHGRIRKANLEALHNLARKFGSFRRQGLSRFLRFLESMDENDLPPDARPNVAIDDDCVTIMTIHASKGLEFPIVFLADLATRFNVRDTHGRMIFERAAHIGLKVVDRSRMIEYPSAGYVVAREEIRRAAREEEMRVLYVAMTRARERLVLVGTLGQNARTIEPAIREAKGGMVSNHTLSQAKSHLEWLAPAFVAMRERSRNGTTPNVIVRHEPDEVSRWSLSTSSAKPTARMLEVVSRLESLELDVLSSGNESAVDELMARVEYVYPSIAVTSQKSAIGASEFKGVFDYRRDPEERTEARTAADFDPAGRLLMPSSASESAHRGTSTHRALQFLNFGIGFSSSDVVRELQRMVTDGQLSDDERRAVDVDALVWFLGNPLAERLRRAGENYHREFAYVSRESPHYFDRSIAAGDDIVLVRGIVDGVLVDDDGVEIVDFKTDHVRPHDAARRAEYYRPQMTLYARAMKQLWKRPVRRCHLVFLSAREIVEWNDVAAAVD